MKHRAYITGIGLLSPIGHSVEEFADSLRHARGGFRTVEGLAEQGYEFDEGAVIPHLPTALRECIEAEPHRDRGEHYGIHCARMALADAELDVESLDPMRIAVAVASSNAGAETNLRYSEAKHRNAYAQGTTLLRTPATVAAAIRADLGARGPQVSVSTACAAGGNSVGIALDLIESGRADIVIGGGVEPFSVLSFSGFTLLKSLAHDGIRPFDSERGGTGLGEAACLFVIESEESVRRRGATPYCELLGYGISDDAHHTTAPDPEGRGAELAIRQCLDRAGVSPERVGYVNAHGTGTRYNDAMELTALSRVFGDAFPRIPLSSTKPLHGHTLSCAGSLELLVCIIALVRGFIPGNTNTTAPMPEFPEATLPLTATEIGPIDVAISNSFGFAGNNTCVAVGRAEAWS